MKRILMISMIMSMMIIPFNALAGSINVSWNASIDQIDGYKISSSSVSGGPYTILQEVAGDTTTFMINNLVAGDYCFVVSTFKTGVPDSPYSNECCSTVSLTAPTGLSCSLN